MEGAATMVVLTHLLGGGSSFSSGGPGKGMHSRLYTRVLNQYGWAHQCLAYSDCFASSGLVGVQASCDPGYALNMLDVMCSGRQAGCFTGMCDAVGTNAKGGHMNLKIICCIFWTILLQARALHQR